MINDINTLEYIFELVKRVKKPIVKIYPDGRIIGTDLSFASMNIVIGSDISYNITIPYIFITTEINAFMKHIQTNNKKIEYSKFGISNLGLTLINHLEMSADMDSLYDRVMDYSKMNILYREDDFNKSIPEMFAMKATDGSKLYQCRIDKQFLMSSFNSIHPATKTDRVDLIIRELDFYSYTAEFIIYKKKANYQLHEFFRFRKL